MLSSYLKFDEQGLIPCIVQQYDTAQVLMLGWMNQEALEESIRSGWACYWSRSRRSLWRKGERSAQWQRLIEVRVDCDQDALLLLVDQTGVACHTGRRTCFYQAWDNQNLTSIYPVLIPPETLYSRE